MYRFIFHIYFFSTMLIFLKNYFLPMTLFLLIPISDFRSTLYEIIILIFGVLTMFLFFRFGMQANRYFNIQWKTLFVASHLIFAPSLLIQSMQMTGFLATWNELFIDLVAEAYRLLMFTYEASDTVGLFIPTTTFMVGMILCALEQKRGSFDITLRYHKSQRL